MSEFNVNVNNLSNLDKKIWNYTPETIGKLKKSELANLANVVFDHYNLSPHLHPDKLANLSRREIVDCVFSDYIKPAQKIIYDAELASHLLYKKQVELETIDINLKFIRKEIAEVFQEIIKKHQTKSEIFNKNLLNDGISCNLYQIKDGLFNEIIVQKFKNFSNEANKNIENPDCTIKEIYKNYEELRDDAITFCLKDNSYQPNSTNVLANLENIENFKAKQFVAVVLINLVFTLKKALKVVKWDEQSINEIKAMFQDISNKSWWFSFTSDKL